MDLAAYLNATYYDPRDYASKLRLFEEETPALLGRGVETVVFTSHLDAAMTMGARHMTKALGLTTNAGSDTLIMDTCFRQCAIDALHSAVKLEYPGPPAPREKRHDHAAHHQTAIHHDPPLEVVDG